MIPTVIGAATAVACVPVAFVDEDAAPVGLPDVDPVDAVLFFEDEHAPRAITTMATQMDDRILLLEFFVFCMFPLDPHDRYYRLLVDDLGFPC
jgi:hypothetical protein